MTTQEKRRAEYFERLRVRRLASRMRRRGYVGMTKEMRALFATGVR